MTSAYIIIAVVAAIVLSFVAIIHFFLVARITPIRSEANKSN